VIADGPFTAPILPIALLELFGPPDEALKEQIFVDPFNVFLVALTAFVGFTTALFSRPYMRIEEQHGR
jgi:hydrogenase-4 component F